PAARHRAVAIAGELAQLVGSGRGLVRVELPGAEARQLAVDAGRQRQLPQLEPRLHARREPELLHALPAEQAHPVDAADDRRLQLEAAALVPLAHLRAVELDEELRGDRRAEAELRRVDGERVVRA